MVCPYHNGLLGPLQPVAPLREGGVDCQELSITDVVIGLGRGETAGQWDRMNVLVLL